MIELIKRLRVQAHENPVSLADLLSLCRKAADVIENLQTENADLRRQIENLTSANAVIVKEFDKKLEELAEVKAERSWSNVKDRLPERNQRVLCIGEDWIVHLSTDWLDWPEKRVSFYVPSLERHVWSNYWMPLPKPPEKEA